MLGRFSKLWARLELTLAAMLALSVTVLILLNVVTRSAGAALFWVDELAIYAMAWMRFLGASAALHHGNSVAISILTDAVPPRMAQVLAKVVDIIVFVFALLMLWFCWRWFNPLDLARHGFDTQAFQGATFNFIYAEPTTTLGIPKFWVWIVMWLFSFGALVHGSANLLGQRPDPQAADPAEAAQ
jgi:TRAP-type C4-dicarboxylate transport system permease small subunit